MSAASPTVPRTAIARPAGHTLTIYLKEAKYEFLKLLRLPVYSLSTILFPVMFYVLFGLLLNRGHEAAGVLVSAYLIATYGTFGVMGASLFGTGAGREYVLCDGTRNRILRRTDLGSGHR